MSLQRRATAEQRAISYQDFWGSGGSAMNLLGSNLQDALRLVPVYSATRLLADQLASAPLNLYRQAPDAAFKTKVAPSSLLQKPSIIAGGAFAWKYRAVTSLLLRGNAFGLVTARSAAGFPSMVEWVHPDLVVVDDSAYPSAKYFYNGRQIDERDLVHIPLYTLPGKVEGLSPLTQFRLTIELGLQAQDFSINWFRQGAFPGGILRNKRRIVSDEDAAKGKKRFKAATANRDLFVTGNDWEFTPITISADDAAFVQSAKLNAGMIAAIYGVDPEDIGGEAANSLTYTTMEQKGIRFTGFPLRPLAVRLEDAVTALHPKPVFAKFDLDSLIRADLKTRTDVLIAQAEGRLLTNEEARASEDRAPLTAEEQDESLKLYPPKKSAASDTGGGGQGGGGAPAAA